MKTFTLILLLLFPIIGFAQNEIQKNSDKIIVINGKTAKDNFTFSKQALADADTLNQVIRYNGKQKVLNTMNNRHF